MLKLQMPKIHGATPREKIIRSLAMLLVVLAVIWAFTKNNEMVMDRIGRELSVWDETKTMTSDEKKYLAEMIRMLKKDFGVPAKVQAFKGGIIVPDLDAKELYIGVSPERHELELKVPALLRTALGDAFFQDLRTQEMLPAIQNGQWVWGVQLALTMIHDQLKDLEHGGDAQ